MLVAPAYPIYTELDQLRADRAVLERYRACGCATAIAAVDLQIQGLERVIAKGRESAGDWLDLDEAVEWSGLSADALRKNYPSEGSHSARVWQRKDLPCRFPFQLTSGTSARPSTQDEPVISHERVMQAVEDALAA
jgi:hypothetical protein